MSSLKERWKVFFQILLDPWGLSFLIGTIVLSIILMKGTSPLIINILTPILSISSGIVGGLYAKKWDDFVEEKVVVTQGRQAISSLKLLLGQLLSLEDRVKTYLERNSCKENQDSKKEIIGIYFEEIIEKCNNIEEEVVKAVEDWKDILPDADIKSIIGEITKLKRKLKDKENELIKVLSALAIKEEKHTMKSDDDIEELNRTKQILQDEIVNIAENIRGESLKAGTSLARSAEDFFSTVTRAKLRVDSDGKWDIAVTPTPEKEKTQLLS